MAAKLYNRCDVMLIFQVALQSYNMRSPHLLYIKFSYLCRVYSQCCPHVSIHHLV